MNGRASRIKNDGNGRLMSTPRVIRQEGREVVQGGQAVADRVEYRAGEERKIVER